LLLVKRTALYRVTDRLLELDDAYDLDSLIPE
jgi:hypothetical protein